MQPTMASPSPAPPGLTAPTRDAGHLDPELGRDLILCHRRKPTLVYPVAGLVLGGMTVLLMMALALDAGSATGSDFAFLAGVAAIFGISGAGLLWYRRRTIALRQLLRICERGVVREDVAGRRVLVRFTEVTTIEDMTIASPLNPIYMVTLRGASRRRTVISSQRYANVDARLTETLRALAPATGRN